MIPGMHWHLQVHLNLFKMGPPLSYLNKQFVHLMSYKGHHSGKYIGDVKLHRPSGGTETGWSAACITSNLQRAPALPPNTAREGQRRVPSTPKEDSFAPQLPSFLDVAVCTSFWYIHVSPGSRPAPDSPTGPCGLENQTEKTPAVFTGLSRFDASYSLAAMALTCPCLCSSRSHEALEVLQHSSRVACVGWAGPALRTLMALYFFQQLGRCAGHQPPANLALGSVATDSHSPCPQWAQDQVGCPSVEFLWH